MCAANSSGAAVMDKTPLVHLTPNMNEFKYVRSPTHECGVKNSFSLVVIQFTHTLTMQ